jgi:NADP-dependent 3-hydroxy acid dehydrogenase YdfG
VVLKEVPGTEVVTIVADVKDPVSAEEAVKATKSRFGRLDVLVANAGATSPADKRGCFNDTLRLKNWTYGLTANSTGGQGCKRMVEHDRSQRERGI